MERAEIFQHWFAENRRNSSIRQLRDPVETALPSPPAFSIW